MATICSGMPAWAEVQRLDGRIVMEEADYRFFITEIQVLRAENAALRKSLDQERADQDLHFAGLAKERAAKDALIEELRAKITRLLRARAYPGIILGGGLTSGGRGEGVVGLGWKLDLW